MNIKMLDNIEAVIFDFDGTLADSMWLWKSIDIEYLGRFGIELPETLQDDIGGMSFRETARHFKDRFNISDSTEKMMNDWNVMAAYKYEHLITPKEGVIDFLEYLRTINIKMGVATSNSRELADIGAKSIGIAPYMDSVRVSCEVANGKPAPDIYLKVASDLQVDPSKCLVFEDISNGLLAGKNACMKTCAVEDDFSAHEIEKKRSIANYYIKNYYDVLNSTYEVL